MEPLFPPDSDWTAPTTLPPWHDQETVYIDLETKDPFLLELGPSTRRGGYIAGISFAFEDGRSWYLPIRHEGGGNMDEGIVKEYLETQAKFFTGTLVAANAQYEMDYLWAWGLDFKFGIWRDVQDADRLIWEHHRSYSLDNISKRWGFEGKDEELLRRAADAYGFDPKGEMWRLPAKYVGVYAEQDVLAMVPLMRAQRTKLAELGLTDVFNTEGKVLEICGRMRQHGVALDFDAVQPASDFCLAEEKRLIRVVKDATGCVIGVDDCMKTDVVAAPLRHIGLKIPKTDEGADSIRAPWLESLGHPVADAIRQIRQNNKLRNTFLLGLHKHQVNGRIHATFNSLRAVTTRMSSSNLSLHQIPSENLMVRKCFVPDEGMVFAACDYSAIEPRVVYDYAERTKCKGGAEAAALLRGDNPMDPHEIPLRLIKGNAQVDQWLANDPARFAKERKSAKVAFLAKIYGAGGAKLCDQIGLPVKWWVPQTNLVAETEEELLAMAAKQGRIDPKVVRIAGDEGRKFLNNFKSSVPFAEELSNLVQAKMKKAGHIVCLGGHHQRVDKPMFLYKSFNKLIQCSAAAVLKKGLIAVWEAGHRPQLPIHDELAGSFENVEAAQDMAAIMGRSTGLNVPVPVDCETSWASWGHSAEGNG